MKNLIKIVLFLCIIKFVATCVSSSYKLYKNFYQKHFQGDLVVKSKYIRNCANTENIIKVFSNSSVHLNKKCEMYSNVCNEFSETFNKTMASKLLSELN